MKIFDREFSGLSQEDVLKRQQLGKTHFVESKTTKTYKEIIFNNIFNTNSNFAKLEQNIVDSKLQKIKL